MLLNNIEDNTDDINRRTLHNESKTIVVMHAKPAFFFFTVDNPRQQH